MATLTVVSSAQQLDGDWHFAADTARKGIAAGWYQNGFDRTGWKTVHVPAFWETYPGLENYDGWGWFCRTFTLKSAPQPMSLYFAGVDDDAQVWVNGVEVGSHAGYTDPFAVEITAAMKKGENTLVVLVKDYAGGGGIFKPITLVSSKHIDDLLKGPFYGKRARTSAGWVKDAVIYSVYLRSFSPEGTFAGLEKRLPELRKLGVTVLWLMPIHPVGVKNRKGTLGSPYSIQDYYGINPEFGTMADFKHLLTATHRNGMKLIIDLVANHTSWDSKLITEHPAWFTHDSTGKIVAPNPDWTDVADLDYSKPGLRTYMEDMMVWWVKNVGIDGFRCDVAELVPTDFWEEARAKLDKVKPIMMLSEGSIPEHHRKAFDITYSWNIYDQLLPILSGKQPATMIDRLLKNESLQYPIGSLRMRFTTNHDKNAWDAPAVEKFGRSGLKAATVLVNTIPGIPLLYTGEEVANDRRLSLFEKVGVDWSRPHDLGDLNRILFTLRHKHPALAHGTMVRLTGDNEERVYAFVRQKGADRVLVVINLHDAPVTVHIKMPGDLRTMKEVFAGSVLKTGKGGDASLTLEPYGFNIFTK